MYDGKRKAVHDRGSGSVDAHTASFELTKKKGVGK